MDPPAKHLRPEVRAQWSSEPAFVFSMAAAAVGLGNLWRFPYMVGENGGGAFILAYLVVLFGLAVPIMMLEVAAGRLQHGSVVTTFAGLTRLGRPYGWFVVALTVVVSSYYLVITGWTMGYAVNALRQEITLFRDFTAGYGSVWYFLAVTALCGLVLLRGVRAIEALSKLLMPVLALMIAGLVGFAATTEGWGPAADFLLRWEPAALARPELWAFAAGQAFYTLAIGQGYLVTYGSYIPRKTHVPRAALIVTATETGVALLAGWMIFPFVFSEGLAPDTGSDLAFTTLPRVFDGLAGGVYLATAFFLLFFFAAFSSCLAGLKVIVAALAEELSLRNSHAVALTVAAMIVLGLPSALSYSPLALTLWGMPVLDFLDRFGGTNVVLASGVIGTTLLCWMLPAPRIVYAMGAKTGWWALRILFAGRSLPFLAVALWLWYLRAG
ncbi:sodium-dependent transporter [Rhodosalinus sp. 5P4]|uniref:sodium-dependent transporter n=1 Tax=Rhodosalinus sp. 5P4 TaxID=3239196 RepID=UPI003525CFCE